MNKFINEQIKVISASIDTLNKKDTLTDNEIQKINNSLVSALKSIETTINDFNKNVY